MNKARFRKMMDRELGRTETFKVVIEVKGGVAYVKECPANVEVEIIDLDDN